MRISPEQSINLSILGLGLALLGACGLLPNIFMDANALGFQLGFGLMLYMPLRKVKFSLPVICLALCLFNRFYFTGSSFIQRVFVPLFAVLTLVALAIELVPIIKKRKQP